MKIHLPTTVEVTVSDVDLLSLLKTKRIELLDGADYAEPDEDHDLYWLWKDNNAHGVGKPVYEKMRKMEKEDYQLLESFTNTIYLLQENLKNGE